MILLDLANAIGEWNRHAFEWINTGLANPFFDVLMPLARQPDIWTPVYAFFAVFFIVNFRKESMYIILFGILTFAITDQLSAHLIKPLVMHPRPCADISMAAHVRLLIPCGAGYGFPSSHATNHFAFSFFIFSILGDKIRWIGAAVFSWALLVSFAQVYVGAHYPLDVICGGLIGIIAGYWMGYLCRIVIKMEPERTIDS